VSRSSDSDVPPSPEPADDHDSIIPGLDSVQPDGQDPAPDADVAASGDPGPRPGWRGRGRGLALAFGGAALVVVAAVLALSHHGGPPGTAAAGGGQATTAPGQPLATAEHTGQPAPTSQAGALPSAPNGVTATGRGGPPGTHTANHQGTTAAAASRPTKIGTASPRTQVAPAALVTTGELPPLAEPPASPTDSPNPVPPVPADRSVSVAKGPAIQPATGTCAGSGAVCYSFNVSVANFPAHVDLAYTCADAGGVWWGPATTINSGTIVTNTSGQARFITYCVHPLDGTTVTIDVGGGGLTASGRYTTAR
jgi:hypothetical protein